MWLAYAQRLAAADVRATRTWPYAYGCFANGVSIPDIARDLYLELDAGRERFGDPFEVNEGTSFLTGCASPWTSATPSRL